MTEDLRMAEDLRFEFGFVSGGRFENDGRCAEA